MSKPHKTGPPQERAFGNASPGWPNPLHEEAFHGLGGDFVRTIEPHSEADPAALFVQFLVAIGNVVGRSPHFRVENDTHHMNLFCGVVGETAKSRKGTSWGHVEGVFAKVSPPPVSLSSSDATTGDVGVTEPGWRPVRRRSGASSGEGLIWHVRDPIPSLESRRKDDPGVRDKRLLVLESEFSHVLKVLHRLGNTLSPVLRCAWDGDEVLETLVKNSPARATGAHISMVGHVTRDELLRYLDAIEVANGFANRILWVCARRSKVLPMGGQLTATELDGLGERVAKVIDWARSVDQIRRDPDADELWALVYPDLSAGQEGIVGAVLARSEAQVMRLACIYALLDMSLVVKVEHLQAALAVWQYCEDSAHFIFGDRLGDRDADAVRHWLREAGAEGMTRTDIRDAFNRNRTKKQVDRALQFLSDRGLAYQEREESGGRPTERWFAASEGNDGND